MEEKQILKLWKVFVKQNNHWGGGVGSCSWQFLLQQGDAELGGSTWQSAAAKLVCNTLIIVRVLFSH